METNFKTPKIQRRMQFKSYYVVWKQKKEKTTQENKKKFKSYYVVWKLRCLSIQCFLGFRLNRTMQYGNRTECGRIGRNLRRFKSYYVVWKHKGVSAVTKSPAQFKSYYVVWKLLDYYCFCLFFFGLNRTMQYGNTMNSTGRWIQHRPFKSYYVVWKQ